MKRKFDENGNEIRPIDPALKQGLMTDLTAYGVSPLTEEEKERLNRDDWSVVEEIKERRRREQEEFQRSQGVVDLTVPAEGPQVEEMTEEKGEGEVSAGTESRQGRKRGPYKKRSRGNADAVSFSSKDSALVRFPVDFKEEMTRMCGEYMIKTGKNVSLARFIMMCATEGAGGVLGK